MASKRVFAATCRAAALSVLGRDLQSNCAVLAAAVCESAARLGMEPLRYRIGHYHWPDGRRGRHAWCESDDGLVVDLQRDPPLVWQRDEAYQAVRGSVFSEGLAEAWMQWLPALPADGVPSDRRVAVAQLIAEATVQALRPAPPASGPQDAPQRPLSAAQWAESQRQQGREPRYLIDSQERDHGA